MRDRLPIVGCVIWILIVLSSAAALTSISLPTDEFRKGNIGCKSPDGVYYIAEDINDLDVLYKIKADGEVDAIAAEYRMEEDSFQAAMTYYDGPWIALAFGVTLDGTPRTAYRMLQYDSELNIVKNSSIIVMDVDGRLTNFSIEDDSAYFTILDPGGKIAYVFKIAVADYIREITEDDLSQDEEDRLQVFIIEDGTPYYAPDGRFMSDAKYINGEFLYHLDNMDSTMDYSVADELKAVWNIKKLHFSHYYTIFSEIWAMSLVSVAVGVTIFVILGMLLKQRNRVAYLIFTVEMLLLVVIAAGTVMVYLTQKQVNREEMVKFLNYHMDRFFYEVDNMHDFNPNIPGFYDKAQYRSIRNEINETMASSGVSDYLSDFYIVDLKTGKVCVSYSGENGGTLTNMFGEKCRKILDDLSKGCVRTSDLIYVGGKYYNIVGRAADNTVSPYYAVVGVSKPGHVTDVTSELIKKNLLSGLFYFVIASIFTVIMLLLQARDLKHIEMALLKIAKGRSDEVTHPRHLFGDDMKNIWDSIAEVDNQIKKINYGKYKIFEAYYRFAPRNIEHLMQKNSMAEVKRGDERALSGTMVVVYLSNLLYREDTMGCLDRFLAALEKCQQTQQSTLVDNDAEFSTLKILFTDDEGDPKAFAADLLREVNDDELLCDIPITIALYYSDFVYGIVGSNIRCYPYLKGGKESDIEDYMFWLWDKGVKLVVTQSVLDRKSSRSSSRYIGYVTVDGRDIKLYELLDCYREDEFRAKLNTRTVFAEALDLFYKSEFYSARNRFADVIKLSPGDRLSAWYLYLCDEYMKSDYRDEKHFNIVTD